MERFKYFLTLFKNMGKGVFQTFSSELNVLKLEERL
jgi:hypothetical protein